MLANSFALPSGKVFQVLSDKVLVELIDDGKEKVLKSGIIVTEIEHRGAPKKGKVLAVGANCKEDIKVGDIAHFDIDRLHGFKLEGLELSTIPWEAIMGVDR